MASLHVTEIVRIFHSGYFDSRGACQTVLDLYCCVMGWTQPITKRNGYFTFHTIIDITGARGIISFGMRLVCRGAFRTVLDSKMLCNGLNIADNEV